MTAFVLYLKNAKKLQSNLCQRIWIQFIHFEIAKYSSMESDSLSLAELMAHLGFRSGLKSYLSVGWRKTSGRFSVRDFYERPTWVPGIFVTEILRHLANCTLKIIESEPFTEPTSFEHTISNVDNIGTGLKVGMKIISINEINICTLKHSDIARLLKKR